jgi:hypothetical protein
MSYNSMTDLELQLFVENLAAKAAQHLVQLKLSNSQMTNLNQKTQAYATALQAQTAAADAAKAATITKAESRQEILDLVRMHANQWQADPSVSDALKQELGLPVHDSKPTPRNVFVPADLIIRPTVSGTNLLRWKRNGNQPGAMFEIEYSLDAPGFWQYLDTSSRASYSHDGQTPGRAVYYRVRAKRTDRVSDWSNMAVAYGQETDPATTLTLEEAA